MINWKTKAMAFDTTNPHIYSKLISMTQQMYDRGHRKISIQLLYNVLRWDHMISTDSHDRFKLNENFKTYYAHKIAEEFPHLSKMFEFRTNYSRAAAAPFYA